MSNSIFALTIDSTNAVKLARFWAAVLGREISATESEDDHVVLVGVPEVVGLPRLVFNNVPERKILKNRVHLDLITTTNAAESARLSELGARRIQNYQAQDGWSWSTWTDIEGNEFDLIDGQSQTRDAAGRS